MTRLYVVCQGSGSEPGKTLDDLWLKVNVWLRESCPARANVSFVGAPEYELIKGGTRETPDEYLAWQAVYGEYEDAD